MHIEHLAEPQYIECSHYILVITVTSRRFRHIESYCLSGVRRQADLMWNVLSYDTWMRDRVSSKFWSTAESLKVSHVPPAVVCK